MRWGLPSLFYAATPLINWYKMACMRDILYRLIWMKFISMLSMYVQSGGTHSHWRIMVLTQSPTVLIFVDITSAPNSRGNMWKHWYFCSFRAVISGLHLIGPHETYVYNESTSSFSICHIAASTTDSTGPFPLVCTIYVMLQTDLIEFLFLYFDWHRNE